MVRTPSAGCIRCAQHPLGALGGDASRSHPGTINSYVHCGNIYTGTICEVRPALPGFTQTKNKSDSTYVKDAGLWLAQGCEETLSSWDREVPAVTSVRHDPSPCTKHVQGMLGSAGGKHSGNQKVCNSVTGNTFISLALTTSFPDIPAQAGLRNCKNHLPSKRSVGEMYSAQYA